MASAFSRLIMSDSARNFKGGSIMIMFKKSGAQVTGRSMKEIMEELFNSSEEYMMKSLCQAMGMSVTSFPDELDEDCCKLINESLGYWKTSKSLAIAAAELQDQRESEMRKDLDNIRRELEAQRILLGEISRKLDKTSKTKAE